MIDFIKILILACIAPLLLTWQMFKMMIGTPAMVSCILLARTASKFGWDEIAHNLHQRKRSIDNWVFPS